MTTLNKPVTACNTSSVFNTQPGANLTFQNLGLNGARVLSDVTNNIVKFRRIIGSDYVLVAEEANQIRFSMIGGARSGGTLIERNATPVSNRRWGMTFRIYNDGASNGNYELRYGLVDTDISNNANWKLIVESNTVQRIVVTSANDVSFSVPANSMVYMVTAEPANDTENFKVGTAPDQDDIVSMQTAYAGLNSYNVGRLINIDSNIYVTGISSTTKVSIILFKF